MWYTVKYKLTGEHYQGEIDDNGLTLRYFSANASEEIYLYLGHREPADGFPQTRSGADDTYDEAPLHNDTVAPVSNEKISDAKTARLWKPWQVENDGKDWLKKEEGFRRTPYNDHLNYATIGIGHLLHRSPVNAQDRANYPNPLTDSEVENLFQSDVRGNGGKEIEDKYFVPLYQREYDALISLGFQFGGGSLTGTIGSLINRGLYTRAGNAFMRYKKSRNQAGQLVDDPKVIVRQNRRIDTFFNGTYQGP